MHIDCREVRRTSYALHMVFSRDVVSCRNTSFQGVLLPYYINTRVKNMDLSK